VPQTGSFEGRFADGRQSRFFYFDDIPARRLTPEILTSEQALEQAKTFARAERTLGGRQPAALWSRDEMEALAFIAIASLMLVMAFLLVGLKLIGAF